MFLLLACVARSDDDHPADTADTPAGPADIATPSVGWFRGDLHFHTNYSDDAVEQGGDWMAGALAIADAWRDPAWVGANPDLSPDDHLQFIAVTDHRTTAGLSDPDFGHPYLAVLGGEEFGSDGHAGIWGIREHIPHEPQRGESPSQRIVDAMAEAHAQGGLFSINHPLYSGDLWVWPTDDIDAVEVWNGPWATFAAETDAATLVGLLAATGVSGDPALTAAVDHAGSGQNAQALRMWQGLLSQGHHVPVVGGSDRHMLLPAGLPTTYVAAATSGDILAGLAAGSTFVSRSPQGPQLLLSAEVDGVTWPMGAALPAGARTATVTWTAARADGGLVRLVGGPVDSGLPEPEVLATIEVTGALASGTWTWTVPATGGWLHGVLIDPLPEVPAGAEAAVDVLSTFPDGGGVEALVGALLPLVDTSTLGDPVSCDPATWDPGRLGCMPADDQPLGSYYIPTTLQPWFSVEYTDRTPTGYAMGAITSAFFVPVADP